MKCSICALPIEGDKDASGKVVWEGGNNAEPINDGRCCNSCNALVVIPRRINDSGGRHAIVDHSAEGCKK